MNRYTIRAFGITKEIIGKRQLVIETEQQTVEGLRLELLRKFPELVSLKSLVIAVNNKYTEEGQTLVQDDEIALIPPVSGG